MISLALSPMRQSMTQSHLYMDKMADGRLHMWDAGNDFRVILSQEQTEEFGKLMSRHLKEMEINTSGQKMSIKWHTDNRSDRERLVIIASGRVGSMGLLWQFSVQEINNSLAHLARRILFSGKQEAA